jgi:hypothetical protein
MNAVIKRGERGIAGAAHEMDRRNFRLSLPEGRLDSFSLRFASMSATRLIWDADVQSE